MIRTAIAALALALAVPAAPGQEAPPGEAAAPPAPAMEDALRDYAGDASKTELEVPIRGMYFTTVGGHDYGYWTARYFAGETVSHDDNIYLGDSGEKGSMIFASTVGGRFTREGSKVAVDVKAAVVQETYTRDTGDNNNLGGWFDLGGTYGMEKGSFVRVTERFLTKEDTTTTTGVGPGGAVIATAGERYRQHQNEATIAAGSRAEKHQLEVEYENRWWNYGRPLDGLDAMQHQGTAVVRWVKSVPLSLDGQAEGRTLHYREDVNNDYDTFALYGGARWVASPLVTLEGRVGYLWQKVDDGAASGDTSNYVGGAGRLKGTWKASPKATLNAYALRDIYPALGSNYQLIHLVGAEGRWEPDPRWVARARLSWQDSRISNGNDGDLWTLAASATWKPAERWELTAYYEYRTFDGDVSFLDYVDNRVGLQVGFQF